MGVVEARQNQLPAGINNARPGPGQRANLGGRADGRDAVPQNRHGAGGGPGFIHRVDGGVEDDEVGSE